MVTRRIYCLGLLALFGCGTEHHHPPPDAPFVEDTPAAMPQLVKLSGSVLAAPKIQPIFFANDATIQAKIEDFATQLKGSAYWHAIGTEYGVGDITVLPTLVATTAAPTTDTALTTFLANQLDGTHPGWTYDPDTIYSVFLPANVVLTGSDGSKSCVDYGAFHDEAMGNASESIVYALMPRCDAGSAMELFELTASASHEWIEAATDPRVESTPAFGDSDPANYIWAYTPGAEVGDYCEYLDSAYQQLVGPYIVQRSWSNQAAMAGHDPCVPATADPYIGAAPILTETATLEGLTTASVSTKAVALTLNASKTIEVQLFSDAETADFNVSALDVASEYYGTPAELSFTWDKQTGHNGDVLHLTVKRVAAGTVTDSLMHSLGSEFVIVANTGTSMPTATSMWWGFASN